MALLWTRRASMFRLKSNFTNALIRMVPALHLPAHHVGCGQVGCLHQAMEWFGGMGVMSEPTESPGSWRMDQFRVAKSYFTAAILRCVSMLSICDLAHKRKISRTASSEAGGDEQAHQARNMDAQSSLTTTFALSALILARISQWQSITMFTPQPFVISAIERLGAT